MLELQLLTTHENAPFLTHVIPHLDAKLPAALVMRLMFYQEHIYLVMTLVPLTVRRYNA